MREGDRSPTESETVDSRQDKTVLRILIAAPSLDILGGQSRQAVALIERLNAESSLQVSFIPHNPRLPGPLRWLERIKYLRTVIRTLMYWTLLLIRVRKCDVLHIYSASYYSYSLSAMPAILIAKLLRRKCVLNYHSGEAEDHLQRWRSAVPTIRLADEIVVPSQYLVEVFARFGLQARPISNIVDLDFFKFRKREKLQPLFLTSRLLEPLYNVGCVLRAFAIIQAHFPSARLKVAGTGPLRHKLMALSRELGLRNCEFLGRIPFEKMPELYDSADIYLTATDIDNMPGSVIESMACGLPVVTTNAGGIPSILTNQQTGLMIPRDDPQAMADAVIRLLEDPELAAKISIKAREKCLEYSWSKVRDLWLDLYHGLHEKTTERQDRLKVLVVAPSLDIIGGQSRQAVRLIAGLKNETELDVGFLPHNPRLPGFLRRLQSVKYVRTFVTTLAYWAMLVFRIPKWDIIHIFSASYYSYTLSVVPALLVAKLFGKKSILNYRSGEAEEHLQNWRTAVPTMKWADEIVVPSGYLVDVFARYGLHARAIYNIVELDRFAFRERHALRPIFLTSRLLEPLYNVPCVLRAFAIIQQHYPEARLTVAADGWLRGDLEALAHDLKLRNVDFIGFVPFEDMPSLYDSADIYLSATNIDNMPSSITESMACGLNVVTTDGGGAIPYIMTNEVTGLIVDRDDHQALAAAAIRLLNNNQLALMLVRNAHESSKKFTWPPIRDEWLNLYGDLVNNKGYLLSSNNQTRMRLPKTDSAL